MWAKVNVGAGSSATSGSVSKMCSERRRVMVYESSVIGVKKNRPAGVVVISIR